MVHGGDMVATRFVCSRCQKRISPPKNFKTFYLTRSGGRIFYFFKKMLDPHHRRRDGGGLKIKSRLSFLLERMLSSGGRS